MNISMLLNSALSKIFFYTVALLALLTTSVGVWADHQSSSVCTKTANLARHACFSEARDDHFIGKGNCINLIDGYERRQCLNENKAEQRESRDVCGEQYHARRDLCGLLNENRYDPSEFWRAENFVDPAQIGSGVSLNPYFSLMPGTRVLSNDDERVTVTVTTKTKVIEGVTCAVVNDIAEEEGVVVEDTDDWYAQDLDGNVWYCGEISQNFELFAGDNPLAPELVDIDGSWKAFREGATPGILVKAFPAVGDVYRQELKLGDAEDAAQVISIDADGMLEGDECADDGEAIAEFVADVCDSNCLVTYDFTPLDPGAQEHKYYLPGEGLILEVDLLEGGCTILEQG